MGNLFIIGVVGMVVITALKLWLTNPAKVGARGEHRVARRLRDSLPPDKYTLLNDVYLPLADGTTTQIDHVVVSRYGVFAVETKNYSGWIFGNASSAEWTQTFRRRKSQFQNPLRQNHRHVCAIADDIGIPKSAVRSVVVFAGDCTFKTEMPDGVVRLRDAAAYIRRFQDTVIPATRTAGIGAAIEEKNRSAGEAGRAAHVANLKRRLRRRA